MNESNALLADQFGNHDERAFDKLMRRHHALVFQICLRMMGHRQDAEDATQETFSRVARYLEHWDRGRPLEPWLVTIAGNRCRTLLSRKRHYVPLALTDEPASLAAKQQHEAATLARRSPVGDQSTRRRTSTRLSNVPRTIDGLRPDRLADEPARRHDQDLGPPIANPVDRIPHRARCHQCSPGTGIGQCGYDRPSHVELQSGDSFMIDTCEQFERALHDRLDRQQSVDDCEELFSHATRCARCQMILSTWCHIDASLSQPASVGGATPSSRATFTPHATWSDSASDSRGSSTRGGWMAIAAILVASLTGMTLYSDPFGVSQTGETVAQFRANQSSSPPLIDGLVSNVDAVAWWQEMQDRDWVAQTMPTVRSVREGVAPLGRSLRRAVTILTTGAGSEQTS